MEYKRGDNIVFILDFLAKNPGSSAADTIRALLTWRGKDPKKRALVQYFVPVSFNQIGYSGAKDRYVGVRWRKVGNGWELTQRGKEELAQCKGRLSELKLG